jgi:HTH-type transcriptional regulator / antitoxin HigA
MIRRPIRTEAEYEQALLAIELFFNQEPTKGSAEADDFDLLALLIDDYQKRQHPIPPPDALSAIRYEMDIKGLTQADLATVLGSRQRASEILLGKRLLSLAMIRALHDQWGIPLESLISSTEAAA